MVTKKTEEERGHRAKDVREGKEARCMIRAEGGPVVFVVQCDPYRYSSLGEQALCEREDDLRREPPEVRERGESKKMAANRQGKAQWKRSQLGVRSLLWR